MSYLSGEVVPSAVRVARYATLGGTALGPETVLSGGSVLRWARELSPIAAGGATGLAGAGVVTADLTGESGPSLRSGRTGTGGASRGASFLASTVLRCCLPWISTMRR